MKSFTEVILAEFKFDISEYPIAVSIQNNNITIVINKTHSMTLNTNSFQDLVDNLQGIIEETKKYVKCKEATEQLILVDDTISNEIKKTTEELVVKKIRAPRAEFIKKVNTFVNALPKNVSINKPDLNAIATSLSYPTTSVNDYLRKAINDNLIIMISRGYYLRK